MVYFVCLSNVKFARFAVNFQLKGKWIQVRGLLLNFIGVTLALEDDNSPSSPLPEELIKWGGSFFRVLIWKFSFFSLHFSFLRCCPELSSLLSVPTSTFEWTCLNISNQPPSTRLKIWTWLRSWVTKEGWTLCPLQVTCCWRPRTPILPCPWRTSLPALMSRGPLSRAGQKKRLSWR